MIKFKRITIDPKIMNGKACIRGMRFPVAKLLRLIAAGEAEENIIKNYPFLEKEDIIESYKCAAWVMQGML